MYPCNFCAKICLFLYEIRRKIISYLCNFVPKSDFCMRSEVKFVKFLVRNARDLLGKNEICGWNFGKIEIQLSSFLGETMISLTRISRTNLALMRSFKCQFSCIFIHDCCHKKERKKENEKKFSSQNFQGLSLEQKSYFYPKNRF